MGLAADPSGPAFGVAFAPHVSRGIMGLCDNKPNAVRSFGLRIAPFLTSASVGEERFGAHSVSGVPSLCMRRRTVDLSLHSGKNSESNPHLLKQNFHELQSCYSDHEHVYADGSKDEEGVGCAAAKYDDCKKVRVPDGSSVFTAEAKAIDLALDVVDDCAYADGFVVFSDSLSVLRALDRASSKNSRIRHLLLRRRGISSSRSVVCCWIRSHVGVCGNEKVDKGAGGSLSLGVTDFEVPFDGFKPFINKCVCDRWQALWDEAPFNGLKEVEPIVCHHRLVPKLSRRE